HFVDDWQGESAFGTMIEFGDGPLDPSYVLEVTMMNSDGKALATTQKFEVKVEFEDDEDEVKIGEVELVAMNVGNDWREQFINVDVDISLTNTKIAPPKVLINVTALSEKSAILKVEPTCDMTLSTGICLGKATVEGNAIGSAYLVEVIALDEDGNTLAKSSQEVTVKPVLTISDIEVKHLGKGIYEYTVEAKYTSSQQLNEKSDFQLSVENEEGSCSLTTELGLVSDDGSTITTTFLKRGGRGKYKKYKSKRGILIINIYESGNNLVVPPASNETSIIDIAAELSKTDLKGYSNTLKEQNKNGIRPTCSGRGSCFYGKCF
ncbi:hypothetical protein OAU52_01300, partial [bacterium]|nr:hypothetical protein [bacterium]